MCQAVTSEMKAICNQPLHANVTTAQVFGPDTGDLTVNPSSLWARLMLPTWPVLQVLSAQVSSAFVSTPQWQTIDVSRIQLEVQPVVDAGTIASTGAGQGPTALLLSPGYVYWPRNSSILSVTYISGWPVAGIDQTVIAGATSVHVDDITGWWSGTAGARGTIYDYPWLEQVTVTGAPTPDVTGAISGPGTLPVTALQFPHTPLVGQTTGTDRRILLSAMPRGMIQSGLWLGLFYGLSGGTTAAVMQQARGAVQRSGGDVQMWHDRAVAGLAPYKRAQF